MNVTGMSQYSRETSSIKRPGGHLGSKMDVQQKLVFIYPILFADKIKVPNTQSFENLIRDFIAVTFLSDMFVQNLFSVIGTANQIRPLWDERNNSVDPTAGILRALAAQQGIYGGGSNSMPNYPVGSEQSPVLQHKIEQKTAVIRRLIKTDPKMSKLRPYIEIITLGNMIDVPVIVGTSLYPVDTLTLMYVLIAAIGLNRKLNNTQDLEVIFKELESMDEKKYWALLSKLIKTPTDHDTFLGWTEKQTFKVLHKVSGWNKYLPQSVTAAARNQASNLQKRINNPPQLEQQRQIFAPLFLQQHDLDQTKLYFKFVLDPKLAHNRFGVNTGDEASKLSELSQQKLQGNFKAIHRITISNFREIVGSLGSSLLRSVTNLISTDSSSINYNELVSQNIDEDLFEELDPILEEIILGIETGIKGSSVEESKNKLEILNSLCDIETKKYLDDFMNKAVYTSVLANDFDLNKYKSFISYISEFADVSKRFTAKLENEIKFLADKEIPTLNMRFDKLEKVINKSITGFLQPFKMELEETSSSPLARVVDRDNQTVANMVSKFATDLTYIFQFALFSQLQVVLCKSVGSMDVDLEMAKNEVTDWPNYTLVLPVEIILALHAALMGMSWDHLLRGGEVGKSLKTKSTTTYDSGGSPTFADKNKPLTKDQTHSMTNVNESYIKPAIKYIANRLGVPNLIVVDSKKGDIYYKMMNQTDINKTKITTIGTFIDSKINHEMTQY